MKFYNKLPKKTGWYYIYDNHSKVTMIGYVQDKQFWLWGHEKKFDKAKEYYLFGKKIPMPEKITKIK